MQNDSKRIALTFDDFPPHREEINPGSLKMYSDKLLESLQNEKIKAVTFVNEKFFPDYVSREFFEKLLENAFDSGLEPGNHTFSHRSLHHIPITDFQEDIINGGRVTLPLLQKKGRTKYFFRYPYLKTGTSLEVKAEMADFLAKHCYINAPVSMETLDFLFSAFYFQSGNNREKIAGLYLKYSEKLFDYFEKFSLDLFGRQIKQVLMLHFNALNIDCLAHLCDILKQRGYSFISLEEALDDPVYRLKDNYTGSDGLSWLHRCSLRLRGQEKFRYDRGEFNKINEEIKQAVKGLLQ
jgi:peptidoglycan/xylan/chitin deacetylase (PgdA/CDA1 family)